MHIGGGNFSSSKALPLRLQFRSNRSRTIMGASSPLGTQATGQVKMSSLCTASLVPVLNTRCVAEAGRWGRWTVTSLVRLPSAATDLASQSWGRIDLSWEITGGFPGT